MMDRCFNVFKVTVVALALTLGVEWSDAKAQGTNLVDQRGMEYEAVAASQTDQVLGATGAAGDYLARLTCSVETAATSGVSIEDGSETAISIVPNTVGGGVGVYTVELGIESRSGGWEITTGAGVTCIGIGRFTD